MRTPLLLAALVGLFAASAADAQVRFLPYVGYQTNAGYDLDGDDLDDAVTGGFLVGVGADFRLSPGMLPFALKIRPSVETVFLSGEDVGNTEVSQDAFRGSLDLIGEFSPPLAPVGIYAGAGVTYVTYNVERENIFGTEIDEADGSAVGANLILGARFGGGFIQPFVQGRYSLADPTPDEFEGIFNENLELGNSITVQAGVSIGL